MSFFGNSREVSQPINSWKSTEDNISLSSLTISNPYNRSFDVPDKFISKLSNQEDFIAGGVLICIGLLAVIGNGFSILMFKKKAGTITAAELLLYNLSWSNLLLAGCSYPTNMVSFMLHRWIIGEAGCQVYAFVCYVLGIVNIFSATALAVVRYLKTCTRKVGVALNVSHMRWIIVGIYAFSAIWSLPPFFGVGKYGVEPFGTSCTLDWATPSQAGQVYILISVMVVVVIPASLMIACYTKIMILVHQNNQKRKTFARNICKQSTSNPSEFQLTLISGLVCIGFIGAWLPYAVVSVYYGTFKRKLPPIYVSLIPVLLAKSSCAYNPLIYIFVTPRYRQEISKLLYDLCGIRRCCGTLLIRRPGEESSTARNLTLSVDIQNRCGTNEEMILSERSLLKEMDSKDIRELLGSKGVQKIVLESDDTRDDELNNSEITNTLFIRNDSNNGFPVRKSDNKCVSKHSPVRSRSLFPEDDSDDAYHKEAVRKLRTSKTFPSIESEDALEPIMSNELMLYPLGVKISSGVSTHSDKVSWV